ncbi:hypothetical protein V2A60_001998 [Cordyceps javanica]
MLLRSVQLRQIASARPLSLARWSSAGVHRALSATPRQARQRDTTEKLYSPEQMNDMIRGSSGPSNHMYHDSVVRVEGDNHVQTSGQEKNHDEPRNTAEAANSKSNTVEHETMPDIENYEPTDAEIAEALASTDTSLSDEGLSTEEAAAVDANTRYSGLAHGEYDSLASEDDILFETSPKEAPSRSRPFKHELLTHQHLGVSALGRPVEALILKDPNRMQRSRKQIPVLESEEADAKPVVELKWTDYVLKPDDEQDPVLEAWDNIDEMRPADTTTIPVHEYHRLVAALVDGFTQGQLSSYITMKHAQELEAQAKEESNTYSWIQKQTHWQPGYQIELESKKPKYVCSATIIDKIWKLDVREQVESLGRALLWVHPVTFRLLTGHGKPVLEAIQREMLNPGNNERLAAKSEESRIGIYASKAAIKPIIARLNEIAQAVTSARLSTETVKKENLAKPILDNLANITNTIIEKSSSGNELIVYWIADSDRPKLISTDVEISTTREGPVDIVWRLLMAGQSAAEAEADDASLKVLAGKGRRTKPKNAVYLDYHREARSKSWCDKLSAWTRYVDVVRKVEKNALPSLQLATRVELAPLLSPSIPDAARISDATFATFGHVLHLKETVAKSSGKMSAGRSSRRILSPLIPHPAALTTLSTGDEPVTQSTAIVLHFSPDTTRQEVGTPNGALPRVRLTLPVDETTDLSNFDVPPTSTLHAVAAQRVQDLLLPTESVDVRLTQQRLLTLNADQLAMRRFLAASEFNLLEGRLRTPSRVTLALPGDDNGAPYLFMGLEVRQAVETRLGGGHTLRYESIEAGQHGGQRQELSLHRHHAAGSSSTEQQTKDDGFLQLVEDLAVGNVFSWSDGAALMQQRSSETFTMDLLEDAALDEAGEASRLQDSDTMEPEEDEGRRAVQCDEARAGSEEVGPLESEPVHAHDDPLRTGGHSTAGQSHCFASKAEQPATSEELPAPHATFANGDASSSS